MTSEQVISKGFYQHSQINDFVSVKNYIFTHKNGKKYLLIQFYSDLKHQVNEMEYTVRKLDAAGKEIGNVKVKRSNIVFNPGSTYISTDGIEVDEKCCDFKVVFKHVRCDRYLYTVNSGNINVSYLKKSDDVDYNAFYNAYEYSAEPRSFGKPKLAAFVAIVAVLAALGMSLYQILISI